MIAKLLSVISVLLLVIVCVLYGYSSAHCEKINELEIELTEIKVFLETQETRNEIQDEINVYVYDILSHLVQ